MNEELKAILEKAYASGKSLDQISKAMKDNGFSNEDVAFASSFYESKKKRPTDGASRSTSAQEPTSSELPVSKSSMPKPDQWEKDFQQARMQAMETGKPVDLFATPTGKLLSEGIKKDSAQREREEISTELASKISGIKTAEDLERVRPEIEKTYVKYKEFDLDNAAPESIFNQDGSFNVAATSSLDSDIKSSMERFTAEQKRLAENSTFVSRGLDALSAGVNGFIDMALKTATPPMTAATLQATGTTFGEQAKKDLKNVSLANYAEKFNMGYTPEQIEKGALSMAMQGDFGLLGVDMLDQTINLAVGVAAGPAGLVALGTTAAGSAWTEVMDDNRYNMGEKMLYAVGSGLAEYATEKIFASDLKAVRGLFGSAEDVAKMSRKDFGDLLFSKLPALARQPLEEGMEEAIVATTQETLKAVLAGEKVDYMNIAESAFVGAAMGGSVGVVTSGPSALLQTPIFKDRIEIRNKISEINNLINDPSVSEDEKELLKTRLNEYVSKERKMRDDAKNYYSAFSEDDLQQTIKLNQTISDGMKKYNTLTSTEAKAQVVTDIKGAMAEKAKIEQKYDSKAQQQVPGTVVEGQAVEQAQPVEGAGTQETQAGGVLQAPQEVTNAAESLGFKVKRFKLNQNTVSQAVDAMNSFLSNVSDEVISSYETTRENVGLGIQSIQNVIDSFAKSNIDVNFVAHTTPESMQEQTGQLERGVHISYKDGKPSEIHVYIPSLLSNTAYHEAIHEIIPRTMGADGVNSLADKLKRAVKRDPQLQARMDKFLGGYDVTENTNDEFLTELASLVSAGDIDINIKKSLATKFVEAVKSVLGMAGIKTQPTTAQLFNGLNQMAKELGAGIQLTGELGQMDFEAARAQKISKPSEDRVMAAANAIANNVNNKYPEAVEQEVTKAEEIVDKRGKKYVSYEVKQVPYRLESGAMEFFGESATDVLVDRIVKDVNENLSNKEVSNGIGWYSKMRDWFQKKFGANIELFGQLLAATSARTPVDINFRQSVDAMRQFSLGKYDDMLNRYHDYVSGIESMSDEAALKASGFKKKSHTEADVIDARRKLINKFTEVPLQGNGKKFNANSAKVLQALYGNWLNQTQGPKTKNFAGNLTGRSTEATIDVWAARYLRRITYQGNVERWRIHPSQEGSVEHTVNTKGELGGDYFFAESVMRKAADKLGWQADDLQAFLWFLEKDVWDKNEWTGVVGKKKSSFEEEAAKLKTERYQAGVTTFKDFDTFDKKEYDKAKKELLDSIRSIRGVVVARVNDSEGEFYSPSGDVYTEPSFDVEFSVEEGTDVSSVEAKVVEIGKRYNQEAVLFSRISDIKTSKTAPIIEIGLKRPVKESKTLDEVKKALAAMDVKGFTISRDSRGNVLGIRTQFISEFEGKPISEGEVIFEKAESEIKSKFGKNEDISYIERNFVETNVFFTANEKEAELQSDTQAASSGTVPGGLEPASAVVRKQAGLGKPGENGNRLDARREGVKTSFVNTYRTADFLHRAIRDIAYGSGNEWGFFAPRGTVVTEVRGRKERGDRDESRYFEAELKFVNRINKTSSTFKFMFRIADHTVPADEARAETYVDDGIATFNNGFDIALNIWSPNTYNAAVLHLQKMFRVKLPKIDSQLLISNSRMFRQQRGIMDILRRHLMSGAQMIDGKYVPAISEEDFVELANKMGISDILAKTLYADILDRANEMEQADFSMANVRSQYEERIKEQPWYKVVFSLNKIRTALFDRQSNIKKAILNSRVSGAYDYLVNKSGASARAKYFVNKAHRAIYSGLNKSDINNLDDIIFLRRVIEIDKSFDDRRAAIVDQLAEANIELEYAQYRVDNMASNISVDKKNKLREELSKASAEVDRLTKLLDETQRPMHTMDRKSGVTTNKEIAELELQKMSKTISNFDLLNSRADAYFNEFKNILNDLFKNGLITKELYDKIKDFDYSPRVFLNHAFDFGDNDVAVRDYGLTGDQVKRIREGSNDDIILDSQFLLSAYAASASSRILKNRANKALFEAALDPSNKEWIKPQDPDGSASVGFETVYFYENGEQVKFQLRTDLKREWDGANRLFDLGPVGNKWISYLSGSALLKLLATRANPLFVVRNFPRDFGHILFFTDIYDNQNIYFASYNLMRDFFKGRRSFKNDDQDFQEYMEMGGGMDFLSTDGRPGSLKLDKSSIDKFVDRMSKIGEVSEVAFRVAVYKRTKDDAVAEYEKKYGKKPTGEDLELIKAKAVTKARSIIDFAQGGNLTKGLEIVKPYINSAFQGFRVSASYIKENPKKFASKFLQAQAGMLALAMANALIGGDDYEDIPDEVKLKYFIIFTGLTYLDEDGVERRAYIRIAKPQQMVPFFALMDIANGYTLSSILGKEYRPSDDLIEYATKGVFNALPTGASLSEITSSIPLLSALNTYQSNYDSFRKRAISLGFGGRAPLPMDEGLNDPNVERFYQVIGKVFGETQELVTGEKSGLSPARLKVSVEKIITSPSSSIVVGAAYGLLDIITSVVPLDNELSSQERKASAVKIVEALSKNGITVSKAIWGETNPDWKIYNKKEELERIDQESVSKRMRINGAAKELGREYFNAKTEEEKQAILEEAKKKSSEIAEENKIDGMYFRDTFLTAAKKRVATQNTNEIIYSVDDESRAKKFYNFYGDMTEEELLEVRRQIYNESGYKLSAKFKYEYDRLRKEKMK
jgi:hypothetical protein